MLINTFWLTNRLARLSKAMLLDSFLHLRSLCLCHLSSSSKVIPSTFLFVTCIFDVVITNQYTWVVVYSTLISKELDSVPKYHQLEPT